MKKTLSRILVFVAALMTCMVVSVSATDVDFDLDDLYTVYFSVETVTVERGAETVSVDINVSQNDGFAMMMYKLEFDESVLSLSQDPVLGDIPGLEIDSSGEYKNGEHSAMISAIDPSADVSGDGVLVTYTFDINPEAEGGSYAIKLVTSGVSDNNVSYGVTRYNGQPVNSMRISGGVIIEEGSYIDPDAPTYVVKYNGNGGTGSPEDDIKYENIAFQISPATPFKGGYIFVGWSTSKDSEVVEYVAGDFYYENADLTLYAVWEMAEPAHVVNITVDEKSARREQTVDVAINISDNIGFLSMEFDILYDKDVLTPEEVITKDGLLSSGGMCMVSPITPNDGSITVLFTSGTANITGNGALLTVRFKVNENAAIEKSYISVSPASKTFTRLDENNYEVELDPRCTEGFVDVTAQMAGDIDLNESVDLEDAILLLQYSMFPDDYPIDYVGSVDFTKDGSVDLEDAILLLQYSMFPEDYPIE